MARKQVTSSKGNPLKVQQLLIPEIEQLQQKELQAQQRLTINKPAMQIPRPAAKQSPKPKKKTATNRLEAPYKKSTAKTASKPAAKPESRTVTFGDTTLVLPRDQHKLAQMKQEALEYWRNLPDIQ